MPGSMLNINNTTIRHSICKSDRYKNTHTCFVDVYICMPLMINFLAYDSKVSYSNKMGSV